MEFGTELPRRTFLGTIGITLTAGGQVAASETTSSGISPAVQNASGSNWTEYQGSAKHTGTNPSSEPLKTPVEVKWKAPMMDAVTTAVAVHQSSVYVGSYDGHVYSFDRETGEEQWKYETDGNATGGIAVRQNNVYAGDSTGRIYTLTTDGALRWSFNSPGAGIYTPISTTEKYVAFTASPESGIKSYLHILDHQGEEILSSTGRDLGTRKSQTYHTVPPTVDGEKIYQSGAGGLMRIGIADGEMEWEGTYANTAPSLVNNSLVSASYGSISATNESDGSIKWSKRIPNDEIYFAEGNSPIVADRTVVTAVGSRDNDKGYVYAHDLVTGDQQWATKIPSDLGSSPVADSQYAYVGDYDGKIYALSLETGSIEWTVETDGPIASEFAIADGVLYVGSNDGYLHAIHNAPPNDPPSPKFTFEPQRPAVGETVRFDASSSEDDSAIDSYEWDTDSNGVANGTGEIYETSFDESGEYTVELVVTDDDGVSKTAAQTVVVIEETPVTTTIQSDKTTTSSPGAESTTTLTEPPTTSTPTSPTKPGLFSPQRGLFAPGDTLLSGNLSAWMLSAVGLGISVIGIVYTMIKER